MSVIVGQDDLPSNLSVDTFERKETGQGQIVRTEQGGELQVWFVTCFPEHFDRAQHWWCLGVRVCFGAAYLRYPMIEHSIESPWFEGVAG